MLDWVRAPMEPDPVPPVLAAFNPFATTLPAAVTTFIARTSAKALPESATLDAGTRARVVAELQRYRDELDALYGAAEVTFADAKCGIDETRTVAVTVPLDEGMVVLDWDAGTETDLMPEHLVKDAPPGGTFGPLPSMAQQVKAFAKWAKDLDRWLGR